MPRQPTTSVHSLIQQNLVWACRMIPGAEWIYHVPNEGKMSVWQGKKLNREGRVKGVFDLFLPVMQGGYGGLYIEVKRPGVRKNGNFIDPLTEEQEAFKVYAESAGYKCVVVRSVKEGLDAVIEYLKGK